MPRSSLTGPPPWPGAFITFEGGEGAGKSTQAALLAERAKAYGREAVLTREPGGVTQAEDLRALLLSGDRDRWSPMSEALMMYAARVEHWRGLIRPALFRGAWVICDRFADSSMAYQGYAGGLGREAIESLHRLALGDVEPDLTFVLDVDARAGLSRAAARVNARGEDATRFEQKDATYHDVLSAAFREIAAAAAHRCVVLPADAAIDHLHEQVWAHCAARFGPLP
jgi:dTMP kinase